MGIICASSPPVGVIESLAVPSASTVTGMHVKSITHASTSAVIRLIDSLYSFILISSIFICPAVSGVYSTSSSSGRS